MGRSRASSKIFILHLSWAMIVVYIKTSLYRKCCMKVFLNGPVLSFWMSSFILVFYCFLADSCIQSPRGRSKKKAKAKRERTERINSNPTIVAKRARSFHVNTVHNQYLNNLRRKKKKPSVYPLVEFRPKQYNRTSQSKNRGDKFFRNNEKNKGVCYTW